MSWASSPKVRKVMVANRSSHTMPEMMLWAVLRNMGLRFEENARGLPGKPDALVGSLAIFMDGDFWHGRNGIPKTNRAFWRRKFEGNRRRDVRVRRSLNRRGLSVMRVWESDIKRKGLRWLRERVESRLS